MNFTKILVHLKDVLGDMYIPIILVAKVMGILIISFLIVKTGSIIIRKVFEKQKTFKYKINEKRIDTMCTLLLSVFRYTTYLIAVVIIFTDVFNLKSVLAAAGIGGLAIGLGAQSLIKDVISGFFIVLEDQFVVGDRITIDTMTGTVENMELRLTKLRNFNGDLYLIPNGEIKKVTNHTRGDKAVIVDIPVSNNADIDEVFSIANSVCIKASKEFSTIVEEPRVVGITELSKDSLTIRIMAKTLPNEQWEVERYIRKLIREDFGKVQIEPSDKQRLIISENKPKGGSTNA
jgi:moderate conductance mechanosensitive channel